MVYYLSLCHAEYLIPSIPIGKCGTLQMTRRELPTIVQPLALPALAESAIQSILCSCFCQVTWQI